MPKNTVIMPSELKGRIQQCAKTDGLFVIVKTELLGNRPRCPFRCKVSAAHYGVGRMRHCFSVVLYRKGDPAVVLVESPENGVPGPILSEKIKEGEIVLDNFVRSLDGWLGLAVTEALGVSKAA